MTTTPLTWDDLPGESANAIAHAEREMNDLMHDLDYGDTDLTLLDVAGYLTGIRDWVQRAINDIEKVA